MVKFPFIMKFARSFRDSTSVYFLTEYIQGVDLFDVIRNLGSYSNFPNNPSQVF